MYVLFVFLVGFSLIVLLKVFGYLKTDTRFYEVSFSSESCNRTINLIPCRQAIIDLTYIPRDFNLNSELAEPKIRILNLKYTPLWSFIIYFFSWKLRIQNIKIFIRDCLPGKQTSLIIVLENVKVSNILSIIGNNQTQIVAHVYLKNSNFRAIGTTRGALIHNVVTLN
jgi:hypothetical protein